MLRCIPPAGAGRLPVPRRRPPAGPSPRAEQRVRRRLWELRAKQMRAFLMVEARRGPGPVEGATAVLSGFGLGEAPPSQLPSNRKTSRSVVACTEERAVNDRQGSPGGCPLTGGVGLGTEEL